MQTISHRRFTSPLSRTLVSFAAPPRGQRRTIPALVLIATALVLGITRLDAIPLRPGRAVLRTSMARMAAETVPVMTSVPPTEPAGSAFQVTVQVDQVPPEGGLVQVTCDHPDLLVSPSGSWPYTLAYPAGSSTTQSFTVITASVQSQTSVTVGSGPAGVDMSNPTNWTSSATTSLTASSPGANR